MANQDALYDEDIIERFSTSLQSKDQSDSGENPISEEELNMLAGRASQVSIIGGDGLNLFLKKSNIQALRSLGSEDERIRKKLEGGRHFRLGVFYRSDQFFPAAWDGIFSLIEKFCPKSISTKVCQHADALKSITFKEIEDRARLSYLRGKSYFDVSQMCVKGIVTDSRYMTEERFLDCEGTLEECRGFLYNRLALNGLFDDKSADFLWFHVFKDVLIRLPHDEQTKQEMLNASRHYYRNNRQELERINEFERTYEPKDSIKWYTKNIFVYRLINKALRTEDVEQMYTYRYFIQDLYSSLAIRHKIFKEFDEPVTVYRGLRLTQNEFNELTKNKQQLISMNGYLSTSFTREVAEMYAGEPASTSDKLSVLLEIECDVTKLGDRVIFADIASESNFQDENEVLFDIGVTFQLATVPKQNDNGVWYSKMIATDEGRLLVHKYIDDHLEFSENMSAKMMYSILLHSIGKYESSLSYFNKLMSNPEDENIALIHVHMARAFELKGDKINEWKHYKNAYKVLTERESRCLDDEARVLIHMGIFCSDRNNNDRALEYITRAFYLFKQVYGDTHEQCGSSNHIVQHQVFIALGNTYRLQYKYSDAINQFQKALDLCTRTLPEYHPEIADYLSLIGQILGDMNDPIESIQYSIRAFNMYCKTLPETELNEKSSVLVDISIALSIVGADQHAIKYFHHALAMKKKCLPYTHPDFAAIYDNLAQNCSNLNRHLLGLRYSLKAYRLRKYTQGSTHRNMVGSLRILATIYLNMGCYNRSMYYMIRAMKILKKTPFNKDPERISFYFYENRDHDVECLINHLHLYRTLSNIK
ncbi:hypothetical protein I4U23_016808 [Adineta vaga]|nr:hypothetical protein I4U23_016808 [Adineta vaga]